MKKFFLIQSGIIFALLYIQIYVQEGTPQVLFETVEHFAMLFSLTLVLSIVVTGFRKLFNRNINFADSIIRISVILFPIYYVFQLLGWLNKYGFIGGR